MSKPVLWILCAALVLAALAGRALAAADAATDYTRTQIVSEKTGFAPGQTLWFAVRQEVRDGWHVFWVNPGDAGIPLSLKWTLPEGYAPGAIFHPAPEYIPVGPLASYAHEGAPVFLVPVTAPKDAKPGRTVHVAIDAMWQVCEDICVPEDAQFGFDLPVEASPALRDDARALFSAARAALPAPYKGAAEFSRAGARYELRLDDWTGAAAKDVFFFPAVEGLTTPAAEQTATRDDGALVISMKPGWVETYDADALDGVVAYVGKDGDRVVRAVTARVDGPIAKPPEDAPPPVAAASGGVGWFLALAFLGGVILNVMPCVFPIIFVKAASFMKSAHDHPAVMRAHGLLFAAGVLATFALMGGVLLVLRAGGEELGWGFHLQSPLVVALSAYVLFLVGLNLFGFYAVGEGLAGTGESLTRKGGAIGAFFTGALAVVVAAPCIGPLLTAPLGAALVLPPAAGMLIFLVMGLGLAAPYLLLSLIPAAGRLLPKPGPWMKVLKQVLAFPVFAAAGYFLWVFAQQTGQAGLAFILSGAIFLALAAWLFEKSKGEGAKALALRVASALAVVAALAPLLRLHPVETAAAETASYGSVQAEPYDAEALDAYRAAGTPVFIDFTAAWCVTCQFNKMTVLKSPEVEAAFASSGTALMVADWTVRDPEITEALEGFGASGVPLYVYYPAEGPAKILPLPLTRKAVIAALAGADDQD